MGRSEELSDFQRGTVVGCHLCKKSVREISALLSLPRSTVSSVILKWKRGGITTALPRSGRPHKLNEGDRQVLERVALEKCLPSVEALTAEFQTATGASVSSRTVRRELHEMGFRGRVSTYNKPKGASSPRVESHPKYVAVFGHWTASASIQNLLFFFLTPGGEKVENKQSPLSQEDTRVDISRLDLRVGRIITAVQLPETDSLYMKQVDVGEASPRTVVSELAKHVPVEQMQNRMAVVLCNQMPAEMSGVVSRAVIMCACSPDKVEILDPPSGALPGDRVTFQGCSGKPDKELDPENKVWEQIQPGLRTDGHCVATYKGAAFEVVGKGVCKSQTLSDSEVK
uniref:tRNA-binding domain-containing protein n=1 Tax=Echeneis naucrates TaxID=173247 RepID=A0A665ULW9_ECHNA